MKIMPGDLVKIRIEREFSPENLQVMSKSSGKAKLHEKIKLESFPSFDDFEGYNKLFKNEILLVIEKKGRPLSFSKKEKWDLYDVYIVMYANKTYDCFSYCMKKISDAKP